MKISMQPRGMCLVAGFERDEGTQYIYTENEMVEKD